MPRGPRGEKRPADANQLAKLIVDIASGQETDEAPEKDEAAVTLGRKGGKARAQKLPKKRRVEIARAAAKTRWSAKNPTAVEKD